MALLALRSSAFVRLPIGSFMQDWYQVPALILTALLLPAFGRLYLRSRDTRTLLWFLAFVFTTVRMVLLYPLGAWDFNDGTHPWRAAIGQSCALLSSALILGSLSPLRIRLGKLRILYVIPYIAPMIVYAILAYGVFRDKRRTGSCSGFSRRWPPSPSSSACSGISRRATCHAGSGR